MATRNVKTTRNMKVYEQSGYKYKATPTITLKGQWLEMMGFEIGTQIQVQCEDGKLIITRVDAETTEAQVPACCVAEKEVRYGRGNK